MEQSMITRVDLTTAVYERAEFDHCTHHDAPITLLTRIMSVSGSWIVFDPPVVVHMIDSPLIGRRMHSICAGDRNADYWNGAVEVHT